MAMFCSTPTATTVTPPVVSITSHTLGSALRAVPDAFRRELAPIRAEITASGPRPGAQLRVNCLTLCAGPHGHHVREDTGMFPALARQHPALASVPDRLHAEHRVIATMIVQLQQVLARPDVRVVEAGEHQPPPSRGRSSPRCTGSPRSSNGI